jgi:hypothetical protein
MGLGVSASKISKAVEILYPDKWPENPTGDKVIRELFNYFSRGCKNGV